MPTTDDRVALLERHLSEILPLRDAVTHLEHRMDASFQTVDRRFEAVDRRFEAIDRRFDTVDRRFDALDNKVSRQFMWLVGIQVTTLAAIVAAVVGALVSLAPR